MENLQFMTGLLERKKEEFAGVYFLPEKWNYCGFTEFSRQAGREGEITVNPYAFFSRCLQYIMEQKGMNGLAHTGAGRQEDGGNTAGREDLCRRVVYGMMVRTHSAWNHYDNDEIISGSFLKSLCLLPLLQAFGVNMIYLLPVCDYSEEYKKGELGSPYAIKNFYKLDENLHDNLLGEYSEELLAREFKAFIEGCHLLGIKVILDFVFRTASRDNDLMLDHPDWFYWIEKEAAPGFHPPVVEKEKKLTNVQDQVLANLYQSSGIEEYLGKFRPSPDQIDAGRWQKVKERQAHTGENILTLIEEEFGITTVPGFSDIINDPQPPWTDVTYLRYYFDLHPKARPYVPAEQYPPFILQDGACLNLYQGEALNKGLWDYIVGVIPFYQQEYGIDGARIDMGHALPAALIQEILTVVRERDPQFIFWSEEFSAENAAAARECGFDFITGSLWHLYKKHRAAGFQRKLLRESWAAELPVAAAPETADTPRFAWRYGDKRLQEILILLNYFLPNTVPFINNGLELAEIQPMNLGLDNTEEGRFVLDAADPLYGKLAFFDRYRLHWLNPDRDWMTELLAKAARLRRRFIATLAAKENFLPEASCGLSGGCEGDPRGDGKGRRRGDIRRKLLFLCYRLQLPEEPPAEGRLFFLANKNLQEPVGINLGELLAGGGETNTSKAKVVYARGEERDEEWPAGDGWELAPGEVVIGYTVP